MSSAISGAVAGALTALRSRLQRGGPSVGSPGSGSARRWPRRLGYVAFFVAAFLFCFYMTFPYDRVRGFLEAQVERAIPGAELEIVSLEPAWLTGVQAEGVSLRMPAPPAPAPASPGEPPPRMIRPSLLLPSAYARVGILSLLSGSPEVTVDLALDGGGRIEGTASGNAELANVDLTLTNVDFRRLTILRPYLPVALTGVVSGHIRTSLSDTPAETDGEIQLTIAGTKIGDERFTLPSALVGDIAGRMEFGQIDVGDLEATLTIEDGVGRVTRLHADGSDVHLRGGGTIRPMLTFARTALDVLVRAHIQPPYLEHNPAIQAGLEIAGNNPLVAQYRSADGAFQTRLNGTVGSRVTALPAGSVTIGD